MPEFAGDKRHEATPYRREQARQQGHVPRSFDLVSAAVLVAAVLCLRWWGPAGAASLAEFTRHWLQTPIVRFHGYSDLVSWSTTVLFVIAGQLLPLMVLVLIVAVLGHLLQTGPLFLPGRLAPNWQHVDPVQGWQRIFSLQNLMRLLFGIAKTIVVLAAAAVSLWFDRHRILAASALESGLMAQQFAAVLLDTCLRIGLLLLLLALLDYLFQYWKYEQDIRMTDQELREELRLLQGDPQILARRRAIQRQMVMNRLSKVIPTADFVVTNPTQIAVAIRYDMQTMPAPIVVAKGAGLLAQRIRRLALEHNVPVIERKALARVLYEQVEVNQPIPVEQYAAVAEILRYVYQLKGKPLPAAG
ncbi:MAG: flagellar biosynthetic protein FlhB [Pirellulaceae bacterium]|nr:MAG: flagellar biosynthetic protein FlhB [Pirellulaceae bacterium]